MTAPELREMETAFWVATYALEVCTSFIEKGRPDANAFMGLCEALKDLEARTMCGAEFSSRAEELHDEWVKANKSDASAD